MSWIDFFERYFTFWFISIPLTIYLPYYLIKTLIELLDFVVNHKRLVSINDEIEKIDLRDESEYFERVRDILQTDHANKDDIQDLTVNNLKKEFGVKSYLTLKKIFSSNVL